MERIRQAVILALGHGVDAAGAGAPAALDPVAGLPLIKRSILTLARVGVTRVDVLVGRDGDTIRTALNGDPQYARAGINVGLVDCYDAPSDATALLGIADRLTGPFLLLAADLVFDVTVARTMAAADLSVVGVHVAVDHQRPDRVAGGLLAAGRELLDCLAEPGRTTGTGSLADGLVDLAGRGRIREIDVGNQLCDRLDTAAARTRAESLLLAALTKPTDGWASRHLNRPISLWVTRRWLLGTAITPNQITVFAGVIGFFGIWLVARATWWPVVAGAFLIHVQSVLDGCDGEVARLKFQGSRLGEWLDNVIDDTMNIFYGLALGHAVTVITGEPTYRWLGVATAVGYAIYNVVLYMQLWVVHRSGNPFLFRWWFQREDTYLQDEVPGSGLTQRLLAGLHGMGRRDVFLLAFFLLCAARLPQVAIAWYAAVAATSGLMAIVHLLAGGLANDLRMRAARRTVK